MKLSQKMHAKIEKYLQNNDMSVNDNMDNFFKLIEENNESLDTRLLNDIIKTFSDKTRFFDAKTGWNQLWMLSEEALNELAKEIKNIKKTITNNKKLKKRNDYIPDDIKDGFSITWNKGLRIGVPENNLERLIALTNKSDKANDHKIVNQVPTPDNGHIDLYYRIDNEISLIELKKWDGNDNPLYAIIELIKNYYLLFTPQNENVRNHFAIRKEKNDIVNLILLAPIDYYIKYANKNCREESLEAFFKLIEKLNLKFVKDNICIKLSYLIIDRDICEKNVKRQHADKLKSGMKTILDQHWKDYIDTSIKKELTIEKINKQRITDANQWKNLRK